MKKKYTFGNVDVLLVDSDLNARQGVRTILSNNGFSGIILGTSIAKIKDVMSRTMPDILLCGTRFDDGDIAETIRDIRHHRIGNNPFTPIIVLLDEPTPDEVTRIMAAGPDDVVMKPISTRGLLDRMSQQIHRRKPYIVTDDYVGPARKGDPTDRAIQPPNPLEQKATGQKARFHEVEKGIESALAEVENRRLENRGPEIAALVGRLGPMLDKPTVTDTALGGLNMLIDLNEEVIASLGGTKYDHVSELCRALNKVAREIASGAGGPPDPRQVKLLKPLSQAIQAGFAGGIRNATAAREIVAKIVG